MQVLPTGGIRVPATLGRVGVQTYRNPDGSPRVEYRPPEAVFAPEALAALRAAPVTVDHPIRDGLPTVRTDTWRAVAVGHTGDDVRPSEDRRMVEGSVVVQDAAVVKRIRADGWRPQVSIGYDVEVDETPGVTPEGERYDVVQRRIMPNHVALVDRGRAGAEVRLRLDADEPMEEKLVKIKIGDKEFEAGSPECDAAIAAMAAQVAREKARADAAERAASDARLAAVRADIAARKLTVRADADLLATMLDAVKQIAPKAAVDGESEDFVRGAFVVAMAIAAEKMGSEKPEKPAEPPTPPPAAGANGVRGDSVHFDRPSTGAQSAVRTETAREREERQLRERAAARNA